MNNPRPEPTAALSPEAPLSVTPLENARPETERPGTSLHGIVLSGAASAGSESVRSPLPKIIPFDGLARCGDEVWIENAGQIYRLRRTRQGKLILTK